MARKLRAKKSPEQIEAERAAKQRIADLAAVGLQPEAAALPRQEGIEITRKGEQRKSDGPEGNKVEANDARRLDAFSALRLGMVNGAYDAARRFEKDLMVMLGLNDRGRPAERVDGDPPTTDRADAMCAAKGRVDAVLDRIPPRDGWLLQELIAPAIDRGTWRDHVRYVTGEAHQHGQAACVRSACVNLRDAYVAIERRAAA